MSTGLDAVPLESGTEITEALRPRWLAERRRCIGSSDAAAIVGASSFKSPLEVYAEKLGLGPEEEGEGDGPEGRQRRFGLFVEPFLADEYERETRRKIARRQVFEATPLAAFPMPFHSAYRFAATLDGIAEDGRIVEFKTVNARNRELIDQLGEPGSDQIPPAWMWQVQWQLGLTGREVADLAVLVGGGDFLVYTIRPNLRLIGYAASEARAFVARLLRRDPPPAGPGDAGALARIYREAEGTIGLFGEAAVQAAIFEEAGKAARAAEQVRQGARARLLEALGPFEAGELPDGRRVKRSIVTVKEHRVRESRQVRLSISKGKDQSHVD